MDFWKEPWYGSVAAEAKKGFQAVLDKKDGYTFLYPFGWQEVVVQGQDKVFKDVIEPLETVSVNMVATGKQDVRDLGPPQQVSFYFCYWKQVLVVTICWVSWNPRLLKL